MIIESLVFYLFASILLMSGVAVITAKNPVHSVLFLILGFFNAAGLFVLLGAEFIAMLLVIVYVGAVAVLFLFVVMMLDINFEGLRKGFWRNLPVGGPVGLILLAELSFIFWNWEISPNAVKQTPMPAVSEISNTEALGQVLYTDYVYLFQTAGLILLVAMIGAITLSLRTRPGVRRQSISSQIDRRPEDVLRIKKVETGEGVS